MFIFNLVNGNAPCIGEETWGFGEGQFLGLDPSNGALGE